MSTIDAERARAVLLKATEMKMREDLSVPESDAAAISEAENIIALCRQTEEVATAVGKERVPLWPNVEQVLMVAAGTLAATDPPAPSPPSPKPVPAPSPVQPPPPVVAAPAHVSAPAPPPSGVVLPRSVSVPHVPAQTPQSLGDPYVEREDPKKGEVWRDAHGGEWEVLSYSGGQTIEVRSLATGEPALGPAGMLKARVRDVPAIAEDAEDVPVPNDRDYPSVVEDQAPAPEQAPLSPGESFALDIGLLPAPPPTIAPQTKAAEPTSDHVPAPEPAKALAEQPPAVVPDDEGDEVYASLLDSTERRYAPPGFPLPRELDEPPAGMPENLTDVDDLTARALHSQYNALAALAKYRHDLEAARARECSMLRKLYVKPAMRDARHQLGKDATVTEVSQLAEDDENVSLWAGRMSAHSEESEAYKTFFEVYSEHVTVLSRDWTMRARQESGS